MVIPKQYPHTITITRIGAPSTDDEGNPTPGGDQVIYTGTCRADIAKTNAFIVGENGKQIFYSSTIYMPLPKLPVIEGDKVSVVMSVGNIVNAEVLAVDKGSQLNNRLWV